MGGGLCLSYKPKGYVLNTHSATILWDVTVGLLGCTFPGESGTNIYSLQLGKENRQQFKVEILLTSSLVNRWVYWGYSQERKWRRQLCRQSQHGGGLPRDGSLELIAQPIGSSPVWRMFLPGSAACLVFEPGDLFVRILEDPSWGQRTWNLINSTLSKFYPYTDGILLCNTYIKQERLLAFAIV